MADLVSYMAMVLSMSAESWQQEAPRVLVLDDAGRRKWIVSLIFQLTIMARDTYTVGGEGVDDPIRMRHLNELIYLAASQLQIDL